MGRPRTPIGTFGAITARRVEATADTRQAAERELKQRLSSRSEFVGNAGSVSADTPFERLVELWLDDLELEGKIAASTRELYERDMRTLVLPSFVNLTLREISVSRVDRFLKAQAKISYSRAKHSKVVLGLALGLAVRYDAIPRNPVPVTSRLRRPKPVSTSAA